MINKLSKYSKYINLPWKDKLERIKLAKMSEEFRQPLPLQNYTFQQENFVHLNVTDWRQQQKIYKLRTYRQNAKSVKPKAIVAHFHGLASHTNRAAHIAHFLAQKGITTVGFDYKGYGKSTGPRGFIQDFDHHLLSAQKFVRLVKQIYPDIPFFAAGLSLGGLTAYYMTLKDKHAFDGAILLAPALAPKMEHVKHLGKLVNMLGLLQYILPEQARLFKVNVADLSKNPEAYQQSMRDQLFLKDRVKLRTILTLYETMQKTPQTFAQYNTPFMVIHGGLDKLVTPQICFDLFNKSATLQKDKEILFYEDMWHNIYFQRQIYQINEKIAQWILQRIK